MEDVCLVSNTTAAGGAGQANLGEYALKGHHDVRREELNVGPSNVLHDGVYQVKQRDLQGDVGKGLRGALSYKKTEAHGMQQVGAYVHQSGYQDIGQMAGNMQAASAEISHFEDNALVRPRPQLVQPPLKLDQSPIQC